jgi:DNA-binding LacI/PurR family transcriptional regulator
MDLGISEQTRQRVLGAMRDLGYRPRQRVAQSSTEQLLAVSLGPGIVDSFANPFHAQVMRGMHDGAVEHGYHLLLIESAFPEGNLHPALAERRIEGVLQIGLMDEVKLQQLQNMGIPVCLINTWCRQGDVDCVVIDGREAGRVAVDDLFAHGHRHIVHLSGPEFSVVSCWLREGYEQRMRELGLVPIVIEFPNQMGDEIDRAAGQEMARQLIERRKADCQSVTAIFGTNDQVAMGAMELLVSTGLRLPDDLSIMGMGDIIGSDCSIPPLTTLIAPKYEMGRLSIERLIKRIGQLDQLPQKTVLPMNKIRRRQSVLKI